MRIALIQPYPKADPERNAENLISVTRQAARQGAELCVAPLETLTPAAFKCPLPLERGHMERIITDLASALTGAPPLLLGDGRRPILVNSGLAANIQESFQAGIHDIHICLDDPAEMAPPRDDINCGDIRVCLKCGPWRPGFMEKAEAAMRSAAMRHKIWALFVNLAGGRGQEVFCGGSAAWSPAGILHARCPAFAPDYALVDTDASQSGPTAPWPCAEEAQWLALVTGTRDFIHENGATKALIGLSGGMDSALVACIAVEAIGAENVKGILMPSPFSSEASITDALELAKNLGIATETIPIAPLMDAFSGALRAPFEKIPAATGDLTFENLQARIRGVLLMALANRSGAMVLNTGNKSEGAMGYCTLYGDTAGALAVIGDILKTRVYELAQWGCARLIPRNIFEKAPSAELRPDQKDTDSLPPYSELDPKLAALFMGEATDTPDMRALAQKVRAAAFKRRQSPPPLLVGGWTRQCL